jgi:uncharacterized protein YjbI with pentapeptide repeats
MANPDHLILLEQGPGTWNDWRTKNPRSLPDLSRANLRNAYLNEVNLSWVDLSGANLRKANLSGANLSGADLHGVDFREANLRKANLSGADLNRADLREADLSEADLRKADLRGADLNRADLREAYLRRTDLSEANLSEANLSGANLSEADLDGANLRGANLSGTNLSEANLNRTEFVRTDISGADLTGSSIYGIAAWDVKLTDDTRQENLIITPPDEPAITVDNIKVAQFIYLLLNNEEIRDVIDTITSKAVLILGRFSDDRKPILNALRDALRNKGFLPIVFDFERPKGRDFTETIMTLAGMSCFVIADITNARSAPLELQATVPDYMVPFVPILQDGEKGFSMFSNLQTKYDWVLGTLGYDSSENLIASLDDAVINPALGKRHELELRKARDAPTRHVNDYRRRPKMLAVSVHWSVGTFQASTTLAAALPKILRGNFAAPARVREEKPVDREDRFFLVVQKPCFRKESTSLRRDVRSPAKGEITELSRYFVQCPLPFEGTHHGNSRYLADNSFHAHFLTTNTSIGWRHHFRSLSVPLDLATQPFCVLVQDPVRLNRALVPILDLPENSPELFVD